MKQSSDFDGFSRRIAMALRTSTTGGRALTSLVDSDEQQYGGV